MNAQVERVLRCFNFARVEKTMRALDWRWHSDARGYYTPTPAQMRAVACNLLAAVLAGQGPRCASGGFEALYYRGFLSLAFVAEEYTDEGKEG